MVNDESDVGQQVLAALAAEPRLDLHRYPVRVAHMPDGVHLEGEVHGLAAKRLAVALACRACGDGAVVDNLRLAPAEARSDAQIRESLALAMSRQRELHNCTVRLQDAGRSQLLQEAHDDWPSGEVELGVVDGEVRLRGRVISLSHKRMIEALAWRTAGCRNVANGLQVAPAEVDNDDEITDAVRLVLEMDPLVHADQVGVRAADGVVTLAGLLQRDEEREMAETDAWSVCGVVDVRNRIEVRAG